ncbi:MAG: hypothetical protein ACLGIN_06350 [Candidatus Sericytochromatia bacterium]
MRPRWATAEDDAALVELVRRCPMHGEIALYFDRAPSFFALSRLQGEGAHVCVIDHPAGRGLAASAAVARMPGVFVNGEPRTVFYACDLRIAPDMRGGRMLKRLYDFLTDWGLAQGFDLGMTTVMQGNAAMAGVIAGKGGVLPYHHLATMRNYTLQTLLPVRPPVGLTIRRATMADVPAMVALWNRVQAERQFAPHGSEASMAARLEGYWLAFRGDRLVGLLHGWDQRSFKRMVVTGFSPGMARMRRWYNPLARVLRAAPIPGPGSALPYVYATRPCAETPEVLHALYRHVLGEARRDGHLFVSTMLDREDPQTPALGGLLKRHVDIELYAMDPQRRWSREDLRGRPAYFDPALV